MRMLTAIAFVPPEDIVDAFEWLSENFDPRFPPNAQNILDYFEVHDPLF